MESLNQFFKKIYCINLKSRTDRYDESVIEFKKHKIEVEFIEAVNGKDFFKPGINRNAGAYGLILTWIKILEQSKDLENILILEDDVMFIDTLKDHLFKLKDLPKDWSMLFLGGNHLFNKGTFIPVTVKFDKLSKDNYKQLNHELCKTTWTQTTHAVALNNKTINELLNVLKSTNLPIDILLCNMQQDHPTYTFIPSLALQRPSFSDIEKVHVDYNTDKRWSF